MNRPSLGLLTLVHKRPQIIPLIVQQVHETWPDAVIHFTMDRPSDAVCKVVEQLVSGLPSHLRAFESPFPALTHKEQFIELRDWQLNKMCELDSPEWCSMWDDDQILEDPAEARDGINSGNCDLLYMQKRFFWDNPDQENISLPMHNSIQFFRNPPGQKWIKMVHAPHPIHDEGRPGQLLGGLMDVGYMELSERQRVLLAYKRAGKLDAVTFALADTCPRLRPFASKSPWHTKIKETYAS